jgi:histone H3/H4
LELTQQVLDKKMTHAAVEVITNLSEEFIEAIFEESSAQDD